jgi:hypothetical protein
VSLFIRNKNIKKAASYAVNEKKGKQRKIRDIDSNNYCETWLENN